MCTGIEKSNNYSKRCDGITMNDEYEIETNKLKRAWIWFWYNDITRMFMVLIPSYFVLLIPLMIWLGFDDQSIRNTCGALYGFGISFALLDNNYSNLRRIGLNEYRKKLK